jgi:hypothetical protein
VRRSVSCAIARIEADADRSRPQISARQQHPAIPSEATNLIQRLPTLRSSPSGALPSSGIRSPGLHAAAGRPEAGSASTTVTDGPDASGMGNSQARRYRRSTTTTSTGSRRSVMRCFPTGSPPLAFRMECVFDFYPTCAPGRQKTAGDFADFLHAAFSGGVDIILFNCGQQTSKPRRNSNCSRRAQGGGGTPRSTLGR